MPAPCTVSCPQATSGASPAPSPAKAPTRSIGGARGARQAGAPEAAAPARSGKGGAAATSSKGQPSAAAAAQSAGSDRTAATATQQQQQQQLPAAAAAAPAAAPPAQQQQQLAAAPPPPPPPVAPQAAAAAVAAAPAAALAPVAPPPSVVVGPRSEVPWDEVARQLPQPKFGGEGERVTAESRHAIVLALARLLRSLGRAAAVPALVSAFREREGSAEGLHMLTFDLVELQLAVECRDEEGVLRVFRERYHLPV